MIPWPLKLKRVTEQLLTARPGTAAPVPASGSYAVLNRASAMRQPVNGWHDDATALRQDTAYRMLIEQMRAGQPRQDLLVAAEAVRRTGLPDPLILEVGCGSGYYSEILSHLLDRPVRYVGLDYAQPMTRLAHERYPDRPFVTADAASLPFADSSFDVVLNGVSLMHILRYETAITESRRIARAWCIFHTVPVLRRRATVVLSKKAYGEATSEIIFNEGELHDCLRSAGLTVRHVLDSIPYDLKAVLGEPTVTKSYVCEVRD